MTCCAGFWMWALGLGVLWWLFASMLVFYTWNKVITAVTPATRMQFGHALLLVFTLMALCAPSHCKDYFRGGCRDRVQLNMIEEQSEDVIVPEVMPAPRKN
ncbi:MAG: hypothetical protein V4534_00680 [Myxococcota bacterium]